MPEPIKAEIDEWHNHFISIQGLQDDLAGIQERNDLLRQEVCHMIGFNSTFRTYLSVQFQFNSINI